MPQAVGLIPHITIHERYGGQRHSAHTLPFDSRRGFDRRAERDVLELCLQNRRNHFRVLQSRNKTIVEPGRTFTRRELAGNGQMFHPRDEIRDTLPRAPCQVIELVPRQL